MGEEVSRERGVSRKREICKLEARATYKQTVNRKKPEQALSSFQVCGIYIFPKLRLQPR